MYRRYMTHQGLRRFHFVEPITSPKALIAVRQVFIRQVRIPKFRQKLPSFLIQLRWFVCGVAGILSTGCAGTVSVTKCEILVGVDIRFAICRNNSTSRSSPVRPVGISMPVFLAISTTSFRCRGKRWCAHAWTSITFFIKWLAPCRLMLLSSTRKNRRQFPAL